MRPYAPATHTLYPHPPGAPAAPAAAHTHDACHRLPAGYANVSLRTRLAEALAAGGRPALVVLAGGSAANDGPVPAAPALRLAQ